MIQKLFIAVIAWLFLITGATAQNFRNEFGFKSDNDAYLAQGSDRYYTNGLFITFRHALKEGPGHGTVKKIWEAEIGQRMYNAQSGYLPDITYADRPITAYLYAGGAMNYYYGGEKVLRLGLQGGVIGPAAIGRETQELLHQIVGFYAPNSWQYQLKNELQLNSSAAYTRIMAGGGTNADLLFEGTVNAGTTFSGAGASAQLRMGSLNPLSSSVSTNSRISNAAPGAIPKREFFFFLRPKINFALYDATVQGGLFRKDKGPVTYDIRPVVFSQELGFMFAAKRWTADFSALFLTKEIKSPAKAHQYGTVSLYYRFN